MRRDVERELLDELPAADPRAVRARQDLQTVHTWMGTTRIMARMLATTFGDRPPTSIAELGAGDGTLLLRVARLLAPRWRDVRVVMVDRQRLVSPRTRAAFDMLSWRVESVQTDVFDWLERPEATESDAMVANLFLHHFAEGDLCRLLRRASDQTGCFLACEPRRNHLSLRAAGLLWLLGCNDVTRHDARISVQAGFTDTELSTLWPDIAGWRLSERAAGRFSHCFLAQRISDISS
jgi:Methyltransferase domain